MSEIDMSEIARRVVRVGFIVAGADGLDDREAATLEDYAIQRSGLSKADIESEMKLAEKGRDSLSDADIEMLRLLPA